jgi:xylan 1,4-beta-xylosidase
MKYLLIVFFVGMFLSGSKAQTWTNPHRVSNEWELYGIGDPYLLKYNGRFYLYCSTRDSETGVKVWSSKDIVEWQYEGLCTTEPITHGAYAPEVIRYGGSFYMYTSPAGNGHYVLKSDSPTGPFEVVTDNLGLSIDGSVFKEDDGSIFFYRSGFDGIYGHVMASPTSIGSPVHLTSTSMNGWTEGPSVIKRNGKYYMIYTGNHVISKGYRINLAGSDQTPLAGFDPDEYQNPVILNSEGSHVGLGHGSLFRGPNLDEHYITYHNLAGDYGVGPFRNLNFDRVSFNGDRLLVHGPTNTPQPVPLIPHFTAYFEDADWDVDWSFSGPAEWSVAENVLTAQNTTNPNDSINVALTNMEPDIDYIAEFNVKEWAADEALHAGAVFNYSDNQNYGTAVLNKADNQLAVRFMINGSWTNVETVDLTGVDGYSIFHAIRIENENNQFRVFVDDMHKISIEQSMPSGKVGYIAFSQKAQFGFCAFTNKINGNSIFDVAKPIPGQIAAVHYNTGNIGEAYQVNTTDVQNPYRHDYARLGNSTIGGYTLEGQNGEWFSYQIMVPQDEEYNIAIGYYSNADNGQIRIRQGENYLSGVIDLPSTNGQYLLYPAGQIALEAGEQTITVEVIRGELELYDYHLKAYAPLPDDVVQTFDSFFGSDWNYTDGNWSVNNGVAQSDETGKRTLGNTGWTDYSVLTNIKYTSNMNGGIIFRVNNPAKGGPGNDPQLGTDFFQGYYVTIEGDGVVLGKQNYNYQFLHKSFGSYQTNQWYQLGVTVKGNNIKVFVDDLQNPVIDYTDDMPVISGKVGLRTFYSSVLFDNFIVTTESLNAYVSTAEAGDDTNLVVYPNPSDGLLYITHDGSYGRYKIYNSAGSIIIDEQLQTLEHCVDLKNLPRGMYIIEVMNQTKESFTRNIFIQ